jgi:hypothetical protein
MEPPALEQALIEAAKAPPGSAASKMGYFLAKECSDDAELLLQIVNALPVHISFSHAIFMKLAAASTNGKCHTSLMTLRVETLSSMVVGDELHLLISNTAPFHVWNPRTVHELRSSNSHALLTALGNHQFRLWFPAEEEELEARTFFAEELPVYTHVGCTEDPVYVAANPDSDFTSEEEAQQWVQEGVVSRTPCDKIVLHNCCFFIEPEDAGTVIIPCNIAPFDPCLDCFNILTDGDDCYACGGSYYPESPYCAECDYRQACMCAICGIPAGEAPRGRTLMVRVPMHEQEHLLRVDEKMARTAVGGSLVLNAQGVPTAVQSDDYMSYDSNDSDDNDDNDEDDNDSQHWDQDHDHDDNDQQDADM